MKVLMYQRIVGDRKLADEHWTCTHIDDFHWHLKLLEHFGYTPVTFNDYRLFLEDELIPPKKPIIITFDDGYYDNYKLAFPLLQEYGMKAVFFVLGDRSIKSNYWDPKDGVASTPLMSDQHILELDAAGIEIGSNTMTHPKLTMLDESEQRHEIFDSKSAIEHLLGKPVYSFSYPYGLHDECSQKFVAEAGYMFACSVFTGPATFGVQPLDIRRITISHNMKMVGFGMRVITPYEYFDWIRGKVKTTVYESIATVKSVVM